MALGVVILFPRVWKHTGSKVMYFAPPGALTAQSTQRSLEQSASTKNRAFTTKVRSRF